MGTPTGSQQRITLSLLDLSASVQHPILAVLDAADLCSLGATCRLLQRRCMGDAVLWRKHCATLLGPDTAALHSVAAPRCERRPTSSLGHRRGSGEDGGRSDSCDSASSITSADEEAAGFWTGVYRAGVNMDAAYFLEAASERFAASAPEEVARTLARSGHTATPVGDKLLVAGGILLSPSRTMDALVVDPARLSISRPQVLGQPPETRFRHTAVTAPLQPGTPLHDAAATQLADLGVAAPPESGTLLLLWGGYNTHNAQFGGPDIQGLWVAEGARTVAWLPLTSTGEAPSRRFHHTSDAFAGGRQMVVLGGEGHACDDSTDTGCPAVYVLDTPNLVWQRIQSTAEAEDACPGTCALHLSTVRGSPETGHEELVVITGPDQENSRPHGGMLPYLLDLTTFAWRHGNFRDPAAHVAVPAARQRPAKVKLAGQWLLVGEGTPVPIGTGGCLKDIHRLHLPTLTWRGPLPLHPASAAVQCGGGFTASGLVMFGGIAITRAGISPVTRHDVLLLGPPAPLNQQLPSRPVTPVAAPAGQPRAATAGQHDLRLSPVAAVGLQQVLRQVLATVGGAPGNQGAACSHCGQAARAWPPAQLVVAGVLAAYAAQLKAADDFSPAWPQAFPEHLRNGGSGHVSASKVPELATPAIDEAAALSLAWFRGVRAQDDSLMDAPGMALTAAEPGHQKPEECPAAAAAAEESTAAGAYSSDTVADAGGRAADPTESKVQPDAAAAAQAVAQAAIGSSSASAAQPPSAPQTPLGIPSLPHQRPCSSDYSVSNTTLTYSPSLEALATGEAQVPAKACTDLAFLSDVTPAAAAAEVQAKVSQKHAAIRLQTDPLSTASVQQQQPPLPPPPPPLTSVQQLGRQLQQLSTSVPPPPTAGVGLHIPPPVPPKAPYPGQQPGPSPHASSPHVASPHGYPHPMLHSLALPPPPPGHMPPSTPDGYHRMVALQASLARWQHPGSSNWSAEAAAEWARAGYPRPPSAPPASTHPRYMPAPPTPPQHAPAGLPPQGGRQQPSSSWAAWARYWQQQGQQVGRPPGAPQQPLPLAPAQRQPFWQGAAAPQPPPPMHQQPMPHNSTTAVGWRGPGQLPKVPPPPPPPPPFPPPVQQRPQHPPSAVPHQAYAAPGFPAGMYGHAAAGYSVDGGMLPMLPSRSAQPRRSRGGQRRRKAAAAAAAAAASGAAGASAHADVTAYPDASGAHDVMPQGRW